MPTNASRFIRRIQVRTDQVSREILPTFLRAASLDALTRVIEKTPVDTGRARGNWQLAVGSIPRGEIRPLSVQDTITEGTARLGAVEAGDTIYIVNNVPYIIPLEFGHSGQAPQGMVRLTAAELKAGGIFA